MIDSLVDMISSGIRAANINGTGNLIIAIAAKGGSVHIHSDSGKVATVNVSTAEPETVIADSEVITVTNITKTDEWVASSSQSISSEEMNVSTTTRQAVTSEESSTVSAVVDETTEKVITENVSILSENVI